MPMRGPLRRSGGAGQSPGCRLSAVRNSSTIQVNVSEETVHDAPSYDPHAGDDPFRGDHDVQGGLDRPSSERLLQHAAEYVDRISRRAKPADLPRGPQLRPRTSMIDCRPWSAVVSAAGYCRPLLLT